MNEVFDYNEIFMGVTPKKKESYFVSFQEDYRLKRLTEAVKIKSGKIADLGSGGGQLTESLTYYYPSAKIYGCDISKTAILYAKKFGSGKITYAIQESKNLPYKSNFFDVCLCLDVLEHIPNVNLFLKEVKRILKKSGKFFLVVPCEGQPGTFTWFFQKIKKGDKLTQTAWGHIHPEFTHESVQDLLRKHGFSIKNKTYGDHLPYQLLSLLPYFFAKAVLEHLLGDNAQNYFDRGIINKEIKKERKTDRFDILRESWLFATRIISKIGIYSELFLLKKIPFTAWKINILVSVNK